jgi:imidazole glycerol-phosphate synthase subunit HisF
VFRPRVIPALLLQGDGLVKTVQFKNPTYVGDPINAVKIFNELKADELVFLDIQATREGRCISPELVRKIGHEAFMPFSVGGGITTINQIRNLIRAGAEKVIIGTKALQNLDFVKQAADECGSQSVVICLDVQKSFLGARKLAPCGISKKNRLSVIEQAIALERAGAGEIMVNCIYRDGTQTGYDLAFVAELSKAVTVPVIACGGAGNLLHLKEVIRAGASAAASGSMFVFHGARRAVLINYPEKQELLSLFEDINENS